MRKMRKRITACVLAAGLLASMFMTSIYAAEAANNKYDGQKILIDLELSKSEWENVGRGLVSLSQGDVDWLNSYPVYSTGYTTANWEALEGKLLTSEEIEELEVQDATVRTWKTFADNYMGELGWTPDEWGETYSKTINNITYELRYGWTYWEDYLERNQPGSDYFEPHWLVTLKDGSNKDMDPEYVEPSGVIEIPASIDGYPVLTIGRDAFRNNDQITEVIILEGVQEIALSAFDYCDALTKISMPESLLYIEPAFYVCDTLKELTVPAGVKWVNRSAFYGGPKLETVTFEGNAPEIWGTNDTAGYHLYVHENTDIYRYSNTLGWDAENWAYANTGYHANPPEEERKYIKVIENGEPPVAEATAVKVNPSSVSIKEGETAAVTATVEPSYAADKTVTWASANTSIATVNNGTITGVKAGTTTVTATCGKVSANVAVTVTAKEEPTPDPEPGVTLPYTDVNAGDWFYDTVADVYEKGLMTGLNQTTFGPADKLARAQFAMILHRMEGSEALPYTPVFPDVAQGVWYTDAVIWAANEGIVTGYTDTGRFGPSDNINREQMAVMMYRYANMKGYDTSQRTDFSSYPDAGKVSDYAQEAMSWCVANGIITGDNGNLNPQGETVRAVCATIISRFYSAYGL